MEIKNNRVKPNVSLIKQQTVTTLRQTKEPTATRSTGCYTDSFTSARAAALEAITSSRATALGAHSSNRATTLAARSSNRAAMLGAISGAALGVLAACLPAVAQTAVVAALAVGGGASMLYPVLTSTSNIGTPRWESGVASLMTTGLFLGAPSAAVMLAKIPSFTSAGPLALLAILGGATGAVIGHLLSDKNH